MVREFYVNAFEHNNCQVFFRGRMVLFDKTTINKYYSFSNIDNVEYQMMVRRDLNWEVIKDAFCSTPWERNSEGAIESFSGKALNLSSKVWHYFVAAKLMLTKKFNVIMKDRAGLIYAIQKNKSIDVGLIIQHSIFYGVTMSLPDFITHRSSLTFANRWGWFGAREIRCSRLRPLLMKN